MNNFDILPSFVIPFWVKALLLICLLAGSSFTGWHFRGVKADRDILEVQKGISDKKVADLSKSLNAINESSNKIKQAAESSIAARQRLDSAIADLIKERREYVRKNPLPVGCRPDAVRLRQLEQAIDAANAELSATR